MKTPLSNPTSQDLVRRVGERVRQARAQSSLSRRALSERSGVSPRFLARLEAGDGNISIARLQDIAEALDLKIEWFVKGEDPLMPGDAFPVERFRDAPAEVQRRILGMLQPETTTARAERICLIGLRGAGKSTLGEAAAKALDVPFIELNSVIETAAGIPVSEIMALYGTEGYRQLEADALSQVIETQPRAVVAVAGGIVAEPDSFTRLLDRFHTVWVRASADDHMARVRAQGDTRPMGGNPQAMEQLRAILTSRETLYARAEARVDTSGATPEQSLRALLSLIRDNRFLTQG